MSVLCHLCPKAAGIERAGDAQRPGERSPPLGLRQTVEVGVNPGTPARHPPSQIEHKVSIHGDNAQQLTSQRPRPATDTSPYRA
jgi:hypothetical protein